MKKVYVLLLLVFATVGVWGQQVIGLFPTIDGGFEGQTAFATQSSIATGTQVAGWTIQNTTTASAILNLTGGRSGPKYATLSNGATVSRFQSPTVNTNMAIPNTTSHIVQFYYRTPGATGVSNFQRNISPDGTGTPGTYNTLATGGTSNVWTLIQTTQTSGTSAANPRYGIGILRMNGVTATTVDIDDYVVYLAPADNTAPNVPGAVSVINPTNSTLDVSWGAASGGVDGGGYVVVRYAVFPAATDDPNQNGIYAVGNTVTGGVNGTVAYIGTGLSFTDAGLAPATTYYYKVYTVDKAFNYSPESEANGTTTAAVPAIVLSSLNPAVAAGNIVAGSTNDPIYLFDLSVTVANATLNGVTITTAGTYTAADITNFKCWYSTDNIFNSGSDILLSTLTPVGVAGSQVFPAFNNQIINSGTTGYIFITADVPCAATAANDISVNAITTADISFVTGTKSGSAFAGGLQTITATTINDVTAPAASIANASSSLSWTNPTGCYNEVLIVAAAGANNSGTPIGDGTAYTGSLNFGSGTALGNGFVVYKGATSPQLVTNLINGTTYYYKFFTRFGTTWSAGVEVSATPASVSSATDYFRTVGSGSWATQATWQSSSDSSTWINATLIPGAAASHVVIQSPDSVYLAANTTTTNLTIRSGAVMNALTFIMTASSRFHLEGTASYYQGGTVTLVPGVEQVLSTTSNYHYNGTQAGTSAALPAYGNLIWEPAASAAGTFQNNTATAPFNNGLVVRGNMTINIQGPTIREIRFATGAAVSRTHTIDGNLNIMSSFSTVVAQNGSNAVTSIVNLGGDLNTSAGIFQGTSSTAGTNGNAVVNIKGNINNTGGTVQTGQSTAGLFNLNFTGTAAQSINNTGGTYNFSANQNITINNSSTGVTLNTPLIMPGALTLTSGIVTTTAVNLLTMGAASSVTGASNASFVFGPVKKIGNTAFTFPVGKANGLVPIRVSNFAGASAATDEFTAEYIRASGTALGAITAPLITRVSACEYWTLNVNNGTPTVDLTLYWNANNPCNGTYITDVSAMEIAHFNGATWDNSGVGFSSKSGTPAAGDVTWPTVSFFSPFALASTSNANPLPITINYFNGSKNNGNHLLNWKVTCVSTPSATLEMERSTDGRNFNTIYSIFATALRCQQPFDYTDNQPAKGVNYYRLKMTDVDGKVSYSSIVSLINAVKGIEVMNIAPNPIVNGGFNLKLSTAEKMQVELVITDMQGRILQKQLVSTIAGFNVIPVDVRNLAAGTYHLVGNTADGKTSTLRFVIQ